MPDDLKITPPQRSKIFALGRQRGLDLAALRAMTPAGWISALTRVHAAVLIEALEAGTAPNYAVTPKVPRRRRRRAGVIPIDAFDVSEAQRAKIRSLQIEMGRNDEQLQKWLGQRSFADGRPMSGVRHREDARDVIELLKHVVARKRRYERQRIAAADPTT